MVPAISSQTSGRTTGASEDKTRPSGKRIRPGGQRTLF